jgi:hypothetical protein
MVEPPMSTSWTSADIVALETAIKQGVKRVAYASGSVDYHSLGEMLTLLDRMRADVAAGGAGTANQAIYAGRVK